MGSLRITGNRIGPIARSMKINHVFSVRAGALRPSYVALDRG